jgi:hypothetical protein
VTTTSENGSETITFDLTSVSLGKFDIIIDKKLPSINQLCSVVTEMIEYISLFYNQLKDVVSILDRVVDVLKFLQELPPLLGAIDVDELTPELKKMAAKLEEFKVVMIGYKKGGFLKQMMKLEAKNARKL